MDGTTLSASFWAAVREPSAAAAGVLLGVVAGTWQAVLMSAPTNDNYLHLALAQQLLGGDWPVRDFFDHGLPLQFTLSAAAQALVGHRLFSEAGVVGAAWAVSTFLVFRLVRLLTGSTAVAVLSSILLIVSGPRGYSYPKVLVYAVAATSWWAYVWQPTATRIAAFGAWVAVAFYWRPDHGVYVAAGLVLAVVAAHGVTSLSVRRCAMAAAVAVAATAPFLLFVHRSVGLREYVETGVAQAEWEHTGRHRWPQWPLRRVADVIDIEPPAAYAPRITIRWTAGSSADEREAILARYDLTHEASEGPLLQHVRLSQRSVDAVRELINEPLVEDTAGIERSSGTLPRSGWTRWERWRFEHSWLRVRLLGGLDEHSRAGEAAATFFYGVPLAVLLAANPMRRYLPQAVTSRALPAFAVFGLVVAAGLLRQPYEDRAVDAVALPAVLFGLCLVCLWRSAGARTGTRRFLLAAGAVTLAFMVLKSVSVSGQFGERAGALTGDWRFDGRMRGAWNDIAGRLAASPPLAYHEGRPMSVPLSLAAYARECVPPSERLLVLWFAPEIYYHAERLMAQRHLVFVPGWADLAHEQHLTMTKIRRFAPPLALASSSLDGLARGTYPGAVDYVRAAYDVAASIADDDREYLILARRDRLVVRTYGERLWPCYQ